MQGVLSPDLTTTEHTAILSLRLMLSFVERQEKDWTEYGGDDEDFEKVGKCCHRRHLA